MKQSHLLFRRITNKVLSSMLYAKEYCYYRLLYSKPILDNGFTNKALIVRNGETLENVAEEYNGFFHDRVQNKIDEANKVCNHIFDILGSGDKNLNREGESGQGIDWQLDFKSGFRWGQNSFYKNIRFGHKQGVDVKVPWELSRSHHLVTLGEAYVLTNDEKYALEFRDQIKDWIGSNPVGFGVNWRCTMDVAIRATNWLVSQEFFSDQDALSYEFWHEFYTSIYEHGIFIEKNLENKGKVKTNHYIADLVGLFFIALYCPFINESERWRDFTLKALSCEIEEQIYSDGCNFEASTSYHRLVLELLFYAELLGERAGVEFSRKYKETVKKLFEFSLYSIKPNGKSPQIGDNDSGRFLVFSKREVLDHSYLLSIAATYYESSQFKISSFNLDEEIFWIFDKYNQDCYLALPLRDTPLASKEFSDAGWYIIRSGSNYCFISCGPNGQGKYGGHAHNDKLSFELMLDGFDIVVDPGSFIYTPYPEERNQFRSTAYHNTIMVENCEQNEITSNIFRLRDRVTINDVCMKENETQIVFKGSIAYAGISHNRLIVFEKKTSSITISDRYVSDKKTKCSLRFHISPDYEVKDSVIFKKNSNEKIALIELQGQPWETRLYDYSPEYGKKESATCLSVHDYLVTEGFKVTNIKRTLK